MMFWRIDREIAGAAARGWLGPMPQPVLLGLAALIAGYYVVLALAGAAGIVLRPPADRAQLAVVVSVIATLFAVHMFSIGHSRYHVPLMPLFAIFAARLWIARREPMTRRRLAGAIATAAILIASWTATFLDADLRSARAHLRGPAGSSSFDEHR
jgi:hypothetical protein